MDQFQIETAQNVRIEQPIAYIGERILAYLIDLFVKVSYVILVFWMISQLDRPTSFPEYVFYLTVAMPAFLYSLLLESLNNGQTIGKSLVSIRVVRLNGTKPAFTDYLIRWVLRIFDVLLTSGAVALFSVLFGGKGQRVGDMAAGTTVISDRRRIRLQGPLTEELPANYVPTFPQVTILSDRDMNTIRRIYGQALTESKYHLISELERKIVELTGIQHEMLPLEFVKTVIWDYIYYTRE
jgi:uncharacterized RDD family membrane protein YckC